MPYRRFPKTDTARLASLKTLLDNNDVYASSTRFIDMTVIQRAKTLHDRLATLSSQFLLCYEAQMRGYRQIAKPQKNFMLYISHFVRVLAMAVERGEIKPDVVEQMYGVDDVEQLLPMLRTVDEAVSAAPRIIEGEKRRIAAGGRPIYNPTVGMVATHFDIFYHVYRQQKILNDKADRALATLKELRVEVDAVIVDIWNEVEAHFASLPQDERVEQCRRYGLIYYYRKGEKR